MSPNIRVDQEVYDVLKKYAEPFVDTPNAVLRRLLKLDATATNGARANNGANSATNEATNRSPMRRSRRRHIRLSKRSRRKGLRGPRVPSGVLLPEKEYVVPILASLGERGGTAPAREIIDAVGEKLSGKLTATDKERNTSGQIRWENRAQFVRLKLVEKGLLAKGSDRGVWSLTEAGRNLLNGNR